MLPASVVDPVSNERADRVEQLPEGHDLSADLGWRDFSNVDRTCCESNTLADTDQDSSEDKDAELMMRCERLNQGSDDGD